MPALVQAIASDGSRGVMVLPVTNQCVMWRPIRTWTPTRTAARHFEALDERMALG